MKIMAVVMMMITVPTVVHHFLAAFATMAECFWDFQVGDVGVEKPMLVKDN
uniref:Transmembrane protein n=1 Tax=Rhizophora mucronata TaxID=61149 RepID=A0A2P2PS55_RHIMU